MADYNPSNPSTVTTWKGLLQIAQINKKESQNEDWFDLSATNGSGNGKCQITNVGYYLGMQDRTKTLMFSDGNTNLARNVIQKYTPFWAAQNQVVGAGKGDESRASDLQPVGKAIGMSNYNALAFAVYNASGTKLTAETDYSLSVAIDQTSLNGDLTSPFTNNESNPGGVHFNDYPYYFSVGIDLIPNITGSIKTYYLVGCNADGDALPQSISKLSATSGYHFQNDSKYIVFKIQQNSQDVTFNVDPTAITFSSDGVAENTDCFTVTSGGTWEVAEE